MGKLELAKLTIKQLIRLAKNKKIIAKNISEDAKIGKNKLINLIRGSGDLGSSLKTTKNPILSTAPQFRRNPGKVPPEILDTMYNKGGSVRKMKAGGSVNSRAIAKKYFKGGMAYKIIAKYGKKAYNAAKKRYEDKDVGPALQLSKDMKVLPAIAALAAISDKRNYKNKTKPKKEKYNPRLKLKRGLRSGGTVNSRAIAKKYFKGGIA